MELALRDVPFEGWSASTFNHACESLDVGPERARLACPRGSLDLAVEFQRWGDSRMAEELEQVNLDQMRYSERVATAVEVRISVVAEHREVVRRTIAYFSLPTNGPHGAQALWRTADEIWNLLGDTSVDYNWYTKRVLLSGVIGSSVLYWLGDTGSGIRTREFIDRRIRDVMVINSVKKRFRGLPGGPRITDVADGLLGRIRAPGDWKRGYPGRVSRGNQQ